MFNDSTEVTVEEVDKVLTEIENKYSPIRSASRNNNDLEENINVLSKEFDSIGLPTIDLTKPLSAVFNELVNNTRCLIQIHRNTVAQMKDTNITSQCNLTRNNYLYKVVEDCQSTVNSCQNKNATLQNRIDILENKLTDMKKREMDMKMEMEKIKRFHTAQKNEFQRHIKKLSDENKKLKEADTQVKHHSKDEVLLKFVGKYKRNEDIYKSTINKLEENNRDLMEEIIDMKLRGNSSSS